MNLCCQRLLLTNPLPNRAVFMATLAACPLATFILACGYPARRWVLSILSVLNRRSAVEPMTFADVHLSLLVSYQRPKFLLSRMVGG
jgi:hypothetical protein